MHYAGRRCLGFIIACGIITTVATAGGVARESGVVTSETRRTNPDTMQPRHIGGVFVFMDYSKLDGLIPAVIQDSESAEVLMVGFMNEEALALTRQSGFATFFSRTRNKLWMKGETSGNRLQVVEILVDCDDDTVLVKVRRLGDGNVCHTGERTCFYRTLP
jgi:phosphoribosyl-ATP pyrophosphohydrolase/phosphoribosyl-AMP cyclohydrolase